MLEDDKDSKTFDASEQKKEDTKKKGQTVRSKELSNFLTLFVCSSFLLFLSHNDFIGFVEWFKASVQFDKDLIESDISMVTKVSDSISSALLVIIIYSLVALTGTIVGNLAIGGWVFAPNNASPKFSKLDPIKGIAKMFSMKTLVDLIKNILKVVLLSVSAYMYITGYLDEIINLNMTSVTWFGIYAVQTAALYFFLISMVLLIVVAIDAPYQIYDHLKNLKMSLKELKDENKNAEGDPHVKAKIKEAQMRASQSRMMSDVQKATVIITNPTHYSVALHYDSDDDSEYAVPVVVALGVDTVAFKIREIAKFHEVLVLESPVLARSLYRHGKIGEPIPESLFKAVSVIINFVWNLNEMSGKDRVRNYNVVENLGVPEDMRFDG